MLMFEAIDGSGKRILIHRFSVHELKAMSLRCPYCLKPLRVRQGRRPHFAHISACSGESSLHVSWKRRIADSLMNAGVRVETEWTIGQRRFDLWIPEKEIGIEIQRSPMSADEWIRRARLDAKQGQTVRWIGFHPSHGVTFRLQGWMRQAFLENEYLDLIVDNQIRRFRHPLPFAKHYVYCTVQSLSLSDFLSTELPSFPRKFSMARWQGIVLRYRHRPFYPSLPPRMLKLPLYEAGFHLLNLPSSVFLPISHLLSYPVHPFEFQMAVFLRLKGVYSSTALEQAVFHLLHRLDIPFERPIIDLLITEWLERIEEANRLF
jgi:competence protein CoiA